MVVREAVAVASALEALLELQFGRYRWWHCEGLQFGWYPWWHCEGLQYGHCPFRGGWARGHMMLQALGTSVNGRWYSGPKGRGGTGPSRPPGGQPYPTSSTGRPGRTNASWWKTKVGPGTYRTADFIEELQKKPGSVRGVCDSREERFRNAQLDARYCYGKGSVLWAALEKRAGSNGAPIMNLSSSQATFPRRQHYEALLASGSSRRGTYDLFTGQTHHCWIRAALKRVNLTPGEYPGMYVGFGKKLCRHGKQNHGVFGMLDQSPAMPTERIYHSTLSQCP
ncbi:unnamed protein product [Coregonus sp. 'balchen']|nr:unnamed protein product [Coregonus sp. 'balchen']